MKPYYERGQITLYHGDAREIVPHLELESIGCIITDPPYGLHKKYGDGQKDTLKQFSQLTGWLADLELPTVFTICVSRLYDLPKKPQWIGVWHKPMAKFCPIVIPLYMHWDALCFYGLPRDLPKRADVFVCDPVRPSPSGHPTPKPLALYLELVKYMKFEGAVLDPFMGSGTTIRACKDLGRPAIGIDREERYLELAARRLSQEVLPLESITAEAR